ncbi:radical SAM protein [Chlorobium phaeovibrioides]|uniref:radical SAM protein n=1 Tax=Chlorobium phaeovibrioides TaxID=1094 RepID=UPI0021F12DBA|nr:radical SAM protein [Chlorobium phaeovibrioides]
MTPEVSKKLIDAGLTRIQISVDAVDVEVYNKIRPGGDLEKVIKNIKSLVDIKKEVHSITPLVRVNFVRTEVNESQLSSFIAYWRDKVDMIGIQEYIKPTKSRENIKSRSSSNKRKAVFVVLFLSSNLL